MKVIYSSTVYELIDSGSSNSVLDHKTFAKLGLQFVDSTSSLCWDLIVQHDILKLHDKLGGSKPPLIIDNITDSCKVGPSKIPPPC